jgi:hypothetical protein
LLLVQIPLVLGGPLTQSLLPQQPLDGMHAPPALHALKPPEHGYEHWLLAHTAVVLGGPATQSPVEQQPLEGMHTPLHGL